MTGSLRQNTATDFSGAGAPGSPGSPGAARRDRAGFARRLAGLLGTGRLAGLLARLGRRIAAPRRCDGSVGVRRRAGCRDRRNRVGRGDDDRRGSGRRDRPDSRARSEDQIGPDRGDPQHDHRRGDHEQTPTVSRPRRERRACPGPPAMTIGASRAGSAAAGKAWPSRVRPSAVRAGARARCP